MSFISELSFLILVMSDTTMSSEYSHIHILYKISNMTHCSAYIFTLFYWKRWRNSSERIDGKAVIPSYQNLQQTFNFFECINIREHYIYWEVPI